MSFVIIKPASNRATSRKQRGAAAVQHIGHATWIQAGSVSLQHSYEGSRASCAASHAVAQRLTKSSTGRHVSAVHPLSSAQNLVPRRKSCRWYAEPARQQKDHIVHDGIIGLKIRSRSCAVPVSCRSGQRERRRCVRRLVGYLCREPSLRICHIHVHVTPCVAWLPSRGA